MRCFYHPGYFFPLPAEHPFPMDKFWRSAEMLRTAGVPGLRLVEPAPATNEQVQRVHTADYLHRIRTGALERAEAVKLGLPASAALLERSQQEVGGTLAALEAALVDGWACNLAGGTHHAFSDRGLGYCVLNDVAIAIRQRQLHHPTERCFVIDTDAHQGNGTHGILAEDLHVFTYSIHVGPNYPAVKTPGTLDVELPRYASGPAYLDRLEATLPSALRTFAPSLIFWIAGADMHEADRFGQLKLTDEDMAQRDQRVLTWIRAAGAAAVVLYGGGYNRDRVHTARLHAQTVLRVAAASGLPASTLP